MATIINTTQPANTDGNNTAPLVVGILLIVLILVLIGAFGSGYFRRGAAPATSNTEPSQSQAPTIINNAPPDNSGSQVNVPDKIDVNVHSN